MPGITTGTEPPGITVPHLGAHGIWDFSVMRPPDRKASSTFARYVKDG